MTIIGKKENVESFLKLKRIAFDALVVPTDIDWTAIRSAILSYLDPMVDDGLAQPRYVRDTIDSYNREFCGFIRDGHAFLCCNMFTYENDCDSQDMAAEKDFTLFMDGGADVVSFVYDCEAGTIVSLDWNGEA